MCEFVGDVGDVLFEEGVSEGGSARWSAVHVAVMVSKGCGDCFDAAGGAVVAVDMGDGDALWLHT